MVVCSAPNLSLRQQASTLVPCPPPGFWTRRHAREQGTANDAKALSSTLPLPPLHAQARASQRCRDTIIHPAADSSLRQQASTDVHPASEHSLLCQQASTTVHLAADSQLHQQVGTVVHPAADAIVVPESKGRLTMPGHRCPPCHHHPQTSEQGTTNDAKVPSSAPPPTCVMPMSEHRPPPRRCLIVPPASEGRPTKPRNQHLPRR